MMVLIVTMATIVLAAAGVLGVVYTAHVGMEDVPSDGDAHQARSPADRTSDATPEQAEPPAPRGG